MRTVAADEAGLGERLRVLTLNLWGTSGDWPARRRALTVGLADLQPDLVALQESLVDETYDQARDLLDTEYHLVHQARRAPDGIGVTVASRWPLARSQELDLRLTPRTRESQAASFPCGALLAEVAVPAPIGRVVFVNHFPSYQVDYEQERSLQAVAVARAIEGFAADSVRHVVVAGDLDADPSAASIRFWTGRQALEGMSVCYRDAWESARGSAAGDTFTTENPLVEASDWPFRRIDYILVRCGAKGSPTLRIADCRLAFTEPVAGSMGSDHFGVVADLAVDDRER